jgi:capsular polysaccharide biosynthesis protein
VFIDRGNWGEPRGLANRDEVLAALESQGFQLIQPELMTVDEIREALSSATICVGVEGSALSHATILMPPGSCIVALVPAYRFLTAMKWFTDAFDMRYGFVVGERCGPDTFEIDITRLHATVDLVERAL